MTHLFTPKAPDAVVNSKMGSPGWPAASPRSRAKSTVVAKATSRAENAHRLARATQVECDAENAELKKGKDGIDALEEGSREKEKAMRFHKLRKEVIVAKTKMARAQADVADAIDVSIKVETEHDEATRASEGPEKEKKLASTKAVISSAQADIVKAEASLAQNDHEMQVAILDEAQAKVADLPEGATERRSMEVSVAKQTILVERNKRVLDAKARQQAATTKHAELEERKAINDTLPEGEYLTLTLTLR